MYFNFNMLEYFGTKVSEIIYTIGKITVFN